MYTPCFFYKTKDGLTGKQLQINHPQYGWMRWGFIFLYILWLTSGFFFLYEGIIYGKIPIFSIIAGFYGYVGFFGGLFAVITGVIALPVRSPKITFAVGNKAIKAGWFQVFWSSIVVLVAVVSGIL